MNLEYRAISMNLEKFCNNPIMLLPMFSSNPMGAMCDKYSSFNDILNPPEEEEEEEPDLNSRLFDMMGISPGPENIIS